MAETAFAVQTKAAGDAAVLSRVTKTTDKVMSELIYRHAVLNGISVSEKPVFRVNTDYYNTIPDANAINVMWEQVLNEQISFVSFYEFMSRAGMTNPNRTYEEEQELIKQQPPLPQPRGCGGTRSRYRGY